MTPSLKIDSRIFSFVPTRVHNVMGGGKDPDFQRRLASQSCSKNHVSLESLKHIIFQFTPFDH